MKRYQKRILALLVSVFILFLPISVNAKEKVTIYFFHGDGCPHCEEETEFLEKLEKKYDYLEIKDYEVWYNQENSNFLDKVKQQLGISTNGVPVTIIGSTSFVGYTETLGPKIERALIFYGNKKDTDIVSKIEKGQKFKLDKSFEEEEKKTDEDTKFDVPLIGTVNAKNLSVPAMAAIIGFVDGFNPCAMWVLLFLISMLIGMKDRKRMWIIGITFLVASALIYMLIMLSWLNVVVGVSTSIIFRNLIAVVAIIGAIINARSFLRSKDSGCEVVDEKKRKKLFGRIQKFTKEKNLFLALIGAVALAVSVNIVELACSAGLPLIFTQILAINEITGISAFIYTLVYIFFFLFDDILIFSIAMLTMKVSGISTKYNKYSHLIGAIIMFIVGILLLVKPEWLMFNFTI